MKTILVPCSIGHLEFTPDQLRKDIEDLQFLIDAFLAVINPVEAERDWDIPYNKEQALSYAKEMYIERGYSKDYIERFFQTTKTELS